MLHSISLSPTNPPLSIIGWSFRRAAFVLLLVFLPLQSGLARYLGVDAAVPVETSGCNAVALAQVPGSPDLFLGRHLLTADGKMAGISGPNDCSGGNPDNPKNGKIFNRWGLVLERLDWTNHKFIVVKPLLDTSIDPATGQSRAIVSSGPFRGAIIQSAYDPSVVNFHGTYLVSYECIIANSGLYAVVGTSACVSVFNNSSQEIDLAHTQVVISGAKREQRFYAAAVPHLLVYHDSLFMYWSALSISEGKFTGIAIRGAELALRDGVVSVKGNTGGIVHAIDVPTTVEVWGPEAADPMSDATVDLRGIWVNGASIIAAAGIGGSGCTVPSGKSKGCFRLAIVQSNSPLGNHVFNAAKRMNPEILPTNPQEYTFPVRDSQGKWWFIGNFHRPVGNGFSEARPVPGGDYWKKAGPPSGLVMFPLDDVGLAPTE